MPKMVDGRTYQEYKDLFKFVEKKCNFHEDKKGKLTWTCYGKLSFVGAFCLKHNLDFKRVKHILEFFGGFCDCEVLMNVADEKYKDIWESRGLMILEDRRK